MDDYVRAMHTKSALIPAIEASTTTLDDAGAQVARVHPARTCRSPGPRRCAATRSASTAGSSTPSSPSSTSYLHYRSIDVSSFKELCRRWYPAVYKKRPGKTEKHRALADVEESIAEMRYYREAMLRPTRVERRRSQAKRSRRAPRSVVTERSRAELPMSPMRHAFPANSPSPPPTSMP